MKVLILFLIALLFGNMNLLAKPISKETARISGLHFFQERLQVFRGEIPDNIIITTEFTISEEGQLCFYVFNFSPEGFVIVAADDAVSPILGYSYTSHYTMENQPAGFRSWMEGYIREIQYIKDQQLQADNAIKDGWERLRKDPSMHPPEGNRTNVEPLLSTKWNQDFPYNSFCPQENNVMPNYYFHVPAGCVATAMAQVMFYWRFPIQGQGYHCIDPLPSLYGPQCADFENTFYQYEGMIDSAWQECDPLALLIYHAGISVDMSYSNQSSHAYFPTIRDALINYFRYSSSAVHLERNNFSTSSWLAYLKGDLDDMKPVIYSGGSGWDSHAFVCDGYQGGNYFHFNWGWGDLFDGYYLLTNLNPGSSNFTASQLAIIHIEPSVYIYPTYCNGQTTITQFNDGSIEDGSGPSKNYRNNSSCSWLLLPNDGIQNISLRFNRFSTSSNDLATIYDGSSIASPILGSFSGSSIPPVITSTGPSMLVEFTSNGTFNENGFQAEFKANPITFCEASTFLTALTGDISDGSEGYTYRNNTSCQWLIVPLNAKSTTLTFEEFSTEPEWDKLEIIELGTGFPLAVISGDYITPPPPVTSSTGMMMIHFTTNKINRGSGWYANYSVLVTTDDQELLQNLKIFPNPTERFVNIEMEGFSHSIIIIEFCSLTGELLLDKTVTSLSDRSSIKMDLEGFSKGVYLLRIRSDAGLVTHKLLLY
ncbi:MAG: C10 family peptidase [Bacteroidia bacterium]|nr:C10 family peptidase [Bacteroidia bacterium]